MKKLDPEIDGRSPDLTVEAVERLKRLFPTVVSEGRVDFDALRAELGDEVDEGQERYGLSWAGKAQARRIAQTPSAGTLRPVPEESVNWDTTQNLFIEGDNLEVLKLLQKSYHRRVKLIYIDPPYNTGNDFIYPDDYTDNLATYLKYTGQVDEEGFKVSANAETSGRYHTRWMNMMYPRLRLARSLLRHDGVVLVSIGEAEAANLRALLGEIFGEENVLGRFVWTYGLSANQGVIAPSHEYVFAAAKDCSAVGLFNLTPEQLEDLGAEVSDACFRPVQRKNPSSEMSVPAGIRSERSEAFIIPKGTLSFGVSQLEFLDPAEFVDGRLKYTVRLRAAWTMKRQCEEWFSAFELGETPEVFDSKGQSLLEVYFSKSGRLSYRKARSAAGSVSSHLTGPELTYSRGRSDCEKLFDGKNPFSYPKPVALLRRLIQHTTDEGDLVLDFFAGSATTACGALAAEQSDGSRRRWIMVQLPEAVPADESLSSRFPTLSRLALERLRRYGSAEPGLADAGWRTFSLASSNIKPWDPDVGNLEDDLLAAVDHIKPDRSAEDVLHEVILKYGLDLSLPIEAHSTGDGRTIYSVADGALLACLDHKIDDAVVERVVELHKDLAPEVTRVVFLDSGFVDDVVKTNAVQTLRLAGIEDVRSI
ncbi:site-specific DNA-methyltransferase [Gemmatimonadota bacterium DH-20]|uniref:site-specific DNA-methyltransferase (adenine-specific) n=1 Tax=Gaopeijia maritima TaxID=3119007 RepID=A0ABU9EDC7_9BACT